MKNLKKIIVVALALGIVLSLGSCRSSKSGCPTNFSISSVIN